MESIFNLAGHGAVNCVPKFICQLGQPDNADGLGNRIFADNWVAKKHAMKCLSSEKLLKHSVTSMKV